MTKNFDADRRSWSEESRTFTLGGETFVGRENIRPDVIADFEDVTVRRDGGASGSTLRELIAATDRAILAMIEGGDLVELVPGPEVPDPAWVFDEENPDAVPPMVPGPEVEIAKPGSARFRYLGLRADPAGTINLDQLTDVARWLVENHTNRPTEPSSPSGNGHGGTGTTLTATSSSPGVPAPTGSPSGSS